VKIHKFRFPIIFWQSPMLSKYFALFTLPSARKNVIRITLGLFFLLIENWEPSGFIFFSPNFIFLLLIDLFSLTDTRAGFKSLLWFLFEILMMEKYFKCSHPKQRTFLFLIIHKLPDKLRPWNTLSLTQHLQDSLRTLAGVLMNIWCEVVVSLHGTSVFPLYHCARSKL
jgi:hypothetical protein